MSSILSEAHVLDAKFPCCIVPHEAMHDDKVKKHVHETVAKVIGWSLQQAQAGIWPSRGFNDEDLTGFRAQQSGKPLAAGWKACFFGFRFDEKARKEVNFFYRSYQHSYVCMDCMAQKVHKGWIPEMSYKNFHPDAAHRMTSVSYLSVLIQPLYFVPICSSLLFCGFPHSAQLFTADSPWPSSGFQDYLQGPCVSPWVAVPGWNVKCSFHDPMHSVFLGTCRDLFPSSLAVWIRNDWYGTGTLDERLRQFSFDMKEACRKEGIPIFI